MQDPLSLYIPTGTSRPAPPVYPTRKLLQPSSTHADDYILELDYSSASKFLECPRAAENYLVSSRESDRDRSATDFGKLFHTLEELRLATGFSDALRQRQHELIAAHFITHPCSPSDHRTAQRMVQILKLYEERYVADGWPQAVLDYEGSKFIERAFKVELCSVEVNAEVPYWKAQLVTEQTGKATPRPFPIRNIHVFYTGRIDCILRDSGHLWVVDHKTSSMGGREFEDAFRLSLQTRGYVWAAQHLTGLPIAGLIMNAVVVRKPTAKLDNNTELNRHPYFYSADALVEFEDNMRAIVSDFVSMLCRGYFPQTARSFKSPCSMCDYSENCGLPRHQRAQDLASPLFRDVTWNPVHE